MVGDHQTPILKRITFLNRELAWTLEKGSCNIYRYSYESGEFWHKDKSYVGIWVDHVITSDIKHREYVNVYWRGFVSLSDSKYSRFEQPWLKANTKEELEQLFISTFTDRKSLLESLTLEL